MDFLGNYFFKNEPLKSDNLQYNKLVRWFAGTNDSLTKCLMFQALFFIIISYRLRDKELKSDWCFTTIVYETST